MFRHIRVLILILGFLSWGLSFILHYPSLTIMINRGLKYNDIVYGVLYPRLTADDKWYVHERFMSLLSCGSGLVVPYRDFFLEYPPFVGLMYFLSINIGVVCSCFGHCGLSFIEVNYVVHSVAILFFHMGLIMLLCLLLRRHGVSELLSVLYIFSPSTIFYLVYNWDVISAFFVVLSLYLFIAKRYIYASLSMALSVSTKLMPVLIVFSLLVSIMLRWRSRVDRGVVIYVVSSIILSIAFYSSMAVLNRRALVDFYNYHSSWYCENCIYQIFIHDIMDPRHKLLSLVAILAGTIYLSLRYNDITDAINVVKRFFSVLLLFFVFSYISTPQMILHVSPLIPLVLSGVLLRLFIVADLLNCMGMLTFFYEHSPWTLMSFTQLLFILRNMIMMVVLFCLCIEKCIPTRIHPHNTYKFSSLLNIITN